MTLKTAGLGEGNRGNSHNIMKPGSIATSVVLGGAGAYQNKSGDSSGSWFSRISNGLKNIWGTAGIPTASSAAKGGPSYKAMSGGTGIKGFFSRAFSSGEGMLGMSNIITSVGAFLGGLFDKSDELTARKLDIQEKLGMEQIRIQEMAAKDAIRRTGLGSMYMGWTPKQADVAGIFEGTPGLTVASPTTPTEVASNSGGIIGGSNQGIISQAKQRQVS